VSDARPPRRKPAFEVVEDELVEDVEIVEEEPKQAPSAKKTRRADPDPEPEPERPRRKKNKKRREKSFSDKLLEGEDADQARRDAALRDFEYTLPFILLALGVLLSVVGAFGAAKGVSGIFTLGVLTLFVALYVPLAIGALMVIGTVVGINYGRLWPAILKMAAITFIVNGIWLLGEWMRLPIFLIFPISCIISFGLFMSQFDLDMKEANVSVGALNVMTLAANLILIGFLVIATPSTSNKGIDDDDDSPPGLTPQERKKRIDKDRGDNLNGQSNPGNPPPAWNPDDDDN
jgi:hypothetical protein